MESMKTAFKAMRAAANDGDWETIASSRAKMLELATAASKEQPMKLNDTPPEKQPQFLEYYQQGIETLEFKLDQLAAAETGNDIEAARSIVEDIGKHSKDSHKSFKKDCD
jgi:soluble cytochrome b562